jgi:undecaprenyl-phosphate 4-deoxy-4-formamido-L-arabinose transferase
VSRLRPQVSVVVPLLDEAATIPALVARIASVLEACEKTFEIVCVDDGSTDDTARVLRELESRFPSLRVFEFTRNFGQAAALACGLHESRGDVVVTMDGDLQNPPEEIPKLLDAIQSGAWIATARRAMRYEQRWRLLASRFVHWLARALVRADIEDFGGQFKAYRREVVDGTRALWAPGKPFFPLALWLGYPVKEISVRHDPRHAGASRYTFTSLVRINLDLVTSFTTAPLAVLAALGAVGFALGTLAIVACVAAGATAGFAAALALTLFAVGGVFLACGALGLYLARIYRVVSTAGPGYVLRAGPRASEVQEVPARAKARHVI